MGTASFAGLYNAPRSGGVASASVGQQVNANNTRQSTGVQALMKGTGASIEGVTGLELPALLALGAIAWLLIYLD